MPGLLNPFQSFGTSPPGGITEPWGEVARQETLSGGKLTVSGLNLTGVVAVQLVISGVTVTTDDSQVLLRYLVAGSEVSTGYRYGLNRIIIGGDDLGGSNTATEIILTSAASPTAGRGVGNASTEGMGAEVVVFDPGSTTLHKRCHYRSTWLKPDGAPAEYANAAGTLENTGALTGFVVYGDSNLTGGSVIVLGVV